MNWRAIDWLYWSRLGMRWLTSLVIAYVFLAVLMTATAQQRVAATLDKQTPPTSYSSAFAKVKTLEQDTAKLREQRSELGQLAVRERSASAEAVEADAQRDAAWTSFAALERRIAKSPAATDCALANEPPQPEANQRLTAWQNVIDCARSGVLPTALREQVSIAEQEVRYPVYKAQADAKKRQYDTAHADLEKAQKDVETAQAELLKAESLKATFDELYVLRNSWYTAGNLLVEFPPSLLQIILAFVSGLFGALLITLILVVYPNSVLASAVGLEYASRLLLGGLISVVVYVMLGGGSAVLGNTSPFGESQGNYMTFCAVGVLAGMFSDRVAAWLSAQARTFFAEDAPKPSPTPIEAAPLEPNGPPPVRAA